MNPPPPKIKIKVFSEIFRVLKPGQVFACYEWCLTPKCVLRCR